MDMLWEAGVEKVFSESDAQDIENARVEYVAAQDACLHYDNFAWQVGAVLIAGVFIYWGFAVTSSLKPLQLLLGNFLVCLTMSTWMLYVAHNRQIYRYKIHRIHELENRLGMLQHRRFRKKDPASGVYRLDWPVGHALDYAVYILVSLGGLVPCLWSVDPWLWYNYLLIAATVLVVACVLGRVGIISRRTGKVIKALESAK